VKEELINIVVGTRPEIIKMAPVIHECAARGLDFIVVHTGQHYSYEMDGIFFDDLGMADPNINLNTGSGSQAEEIGRILLGMERVIGERKPRLVLCQGDTNTVLAASIATSRAGVMLGHVEAGLRSEDLSMPEEVNRIIADKLSDLLFAPAERARANLLKEGIDGDKVFVTGNTIVDAVLSNIDEERAGQLLERYGLKEGEYFLLTLHRQENVDEPSVLLSIMEGLREVNNEFPLEMIFPSHPRTVKNMRKMSIEPDFLRVVEPVGYKDFLQLLSKSRLVLTDSGGIQEEACVLRVPCVTVRTSTERPETVEIGSNVVAGVEAEGILMGARRMLSVERDWNNPFGDGKAAKRIVDIVIDNMM
jgi:UDP-N-acetylglucosamine 2-epimerase (non-hydrolysing)